VEHIRVVVNSPSVVSEVIEGEAVIMNLATGRYYSCLGVGGEIWSLIEGGATKARIHQDILARYAVEPATLESAFEAFLSDMKEHHLVRIEAVPESGTVAETQAEEAEATPSKAPFQMPTLNVHSDMEDLLLLDPIHDVDETGWPQPKPAEEGVA